MFEELVRASEHKLSVRREYKLIRIARPLEDISPKYGHTSALHIAIDVTFDSCLAMSSGRPLLRSPTTEPTMNGITKPRAVRTRLLYLFGRLPTFIEYDEFLPHL
jgi:hypothetical protein